MKSFNFSPIKLYLKNDCYKIFLSPMCFKQIDRTVFKRLVLNILSATEFYKDLAGISSLALTSEVLQNFNFWRFFFLEYQAQVKSSVG